MQKVPFNRFITTFLLFNKDMPYIIQKLKEFGYHITEEEVGKIFTDIRETLPEKYSSLIENKQIFDIKDENHVQWLKQLGVFEYYDFIVRQGSNIKDPPDYFKWCKDCLWVHGYSDVMTLINVLLFNGEEYEDISKIISFKYNKKLGVDTLELYEKTFWDSKGITAQEALYFCTHFKDNTLIIRKLRSGDQDITLVGKSTDTDHDGSDVPFLFHDTNYIKWKIGYRDIKVPAPKEFMEQIQQDSYYKYYEALHMDQSIEVQKETGFDDRLGEYHKDTTRHRNVEENRAKLMKHYAELYLKANASMPTGGVKAEEFFENMAQLELAYDKEQDKLARIDDMPDVLNDIKGDMNGLQEAPEG